MNKTFKQFINEASIDAQEDRVTKLSLEKAVDVLREHCSKFMNELLPGVPPLYRGFRRSFGNAAQLDYSDSVRKSENMNNFNTLMFDNNPSNKNYPKRSKSVICTTSRLRANSYGIHTENTYAIIPYDGAKIASVNEEDIWDTNMSYFPFKVERFGDHYKWPNFAKSVEFGIGSILYSKPDEIVGATQLKGDWFLNFKEFEDNMRRYVFQKLLADKEFADDLFEYYESKDDTFVKWIIKLTRKHNSPKGCWDEFKAEIFKALNASSALGFSIHQSFPAQQNVECWFEGPCVAININEFSKVLKMYKAENENI